MYSLKPKQKKKQKKQDKLNQSSNQTKNKKNQSKKISKTVYEDPFYYKIQVIPFQQAIQVQKLLAKNIQCLRSKMPAKQVRGGLEKVIKFNENKQIQKKKSPLICEQLKIGAKSVRNTIIRAIRQQNQDFLPKIIIIFYDQKKHQNLEQLLCLIKNQNLPYILTKQSPEINRQLGVRTVGVIAIFHTQIAKQFLRYVGLSQIEIPWLIQMQNIIDDKK